MHQGYIFVILYVFWSFIVLSYEYPNPHPTVWQTTHVSHRGIHSNGHSVSHFSIGGSKHTVSRIGGSSLFPPLLPSLPPPPLMRRRPQMTQVTMYRSNQPPFGRRGKGRNGMAMSFVVQPSSRRRKRYIDSDESKSNRRRKRRGRSSRRHRSSDDSYSSDSDYSRSRRRRQRRRENERSRRDRSRSRGRR